MSEPVPQEDVSINSLGDDLLLLIFEALPFSSKVDVPRNCVCVVCWSERPHIRLVCALGL